jgi:hypothetical protein
MLDKRLNTFLVTNFALIITRNVFSNVKEAYITVNGLVQDLSSISEVVHFRNEKNEMDGERSMYGGEERFIQGFGGKA